MASTARPDDVPDDAAAEQPISVPESNDAGESGKLKMIVQLVKKCLGVKDIASMCVRSAALFRVPILTALVVPQASLVASVPPRARPQPRVLALPRPAGLVRCVSDSSIP